MPKHIDQYVPLSQVNAYLPDRLHLNMKFPDWFNPDSLGLNVQRLVGLQTIAGIHLVDIQGKFEKETTKVSAGAPHRGGHDSKGQGTGVSTLTTQFHTSNVPTYHELAEGLINGEHVHALRWLKAMTIHMNLAEMSQRIREKGGNIKKPHEWATFMDKAVRQSVRKEGTKFLLQLSKYDLFLLTMLIGQQIINLPSKFVLDTPTPMSIFSRALLDLFVAQTFVVGVSGAIKKLVTKKDVDLRWSFFPFGPEIDQAIMLNVLSRKILIRPMEGLKEEQIYHLDTPTKEEKDE